MIDLHNPSPLVMTTFEKISTITAFSVLAIAVVSDIWKYRRRKQTGIDQRKEIITREDRK